MSRLLIRFLIYFVRPTLKNWRALRRVAMERLPKVDRETAKAERSS